jgi:ketosteroid isomerase-like protein
MASSEHLQGLRPVELAEALFPREIDMAEFARSGGRLPPELTARIAPDLEVEFLPKVLGSGIGGKGLAGLAEGWLEWVEPYETYVITIEDFEELGEEDVFIPVRVRARTHRDGVLIEHTPASVATIRDGILVRIRFYLDRELARAETGGG